MKLRVATTAAGLTMLAAFAAQGQTTIEWIGFSKDGGQFLLLVKDPMHGDYYSLRDFKTGKQKKGFFVEDPGQQFSMGLKLAKRYNIVDKGREAMQSPDGKYVVIGVPDGRRFHIMVMRAKLKAKLKTLDVPSDRKGNPGSIQMKTAFWNESGDKVVIIVREKTSGEFGVDRDRPVPVSFYPATLDFK